MILKLMEWNRKDSDYFVEIIPFRKWVWPTYQSTSDLLYEVDLVIGLMVYM